MERIVTYSPAYTLVPTYECFNRCTYCNFRRDPGQDNWMSLAKAQEILDRLPADQVIEVLILSGEVHPRSKRRAAWFQRIYQLCELALANGFLPHTNVGPLSYAEMAQLQQVNVSMGLMVEQVTPTLLETVHAHAPSKLPEVRLQQLEFAGKLRIPFTTGLLLGLGETEDDWANEFGGDRPLSPKLAPHSRSHFAAPSARPHSDRAAIALPRQNSLTGCENCPRESTC